MTCWARFSCCHSAGLPTTAVSHRPWASASECFILHDVWHTRNAAYCMSCTFLQSLYSTNLCVVFRLVMALVHLFDTDLSPTPRFRTLDGRLPFLPDDSLDGRTCGPPSGGTVFSSKERRVRENGASSVLLLVWPQSETLGPWPRHRAASQSNWTWKSKVFDVEPPRDPSLTLPVLRTEQLIPDGFDGDLKLRNTGGVGSTVWRVLRGLGRGVWWFRWSQERRPVCGSLWMTLCRWCKCGSKPFNVPFIDAN